MLHHILTPARHTLAISLLVPPAKTLEHMDVLEVLVSEHLQVLEHYHKPTKDTQPTKDTWPGVKTTQECHSRDSTTTQHLSYLNWCQLVYQLKDTNS